MSATQHIFTGKWITDAVFASLTPKNVFHRQLSPIEIPTQAPQNAHILFRRRFTVPKSGGKATLYISADDYYKLYLNGQPVCQGPAPGYPFHYYYNAVDVTDYLQAGENVLAVHTYYQGLINRVWVSGDDRHGLILDLEQDGQLLLSSDQTFLCARHSGYTECGRFGYDTQFAEFYHSTAAEVGFTAPDYDDSAWTPASLHPHADHQLFLQESAMLETETVLPTVRRQGETELFLDFGSIYVGYLRATAKGKAGDVVEILCGQEQNEDGSVRYQLRANCTYRELWELSGGTDTLEQYDYKSFRYVLLRFPAGCEITNVSLLARHYPFSLQAKPNTSDPTLLRVWQLCVNTLRYGVQEVIQDCMEREKGNYLGDGCYSALTHYALTKDSSMLKKLVDDSLRSAFINGGLMTCAACSFMQEIAEYPLMLYHTLCRYHELSGDTAYLAQHYDALCAILDFYRQQYAQADGLLCHLDKWCVVEWPAPYRDGYDADLTEGQICHDLHCVINAHYLGALQCMNRIAKLTGHPPYCDTSALMEAFVHTFYDKEKHLFLDRAGSTHISLIANVFPFMYGIFPDAETEGAIRRLIAERGFTRVMLFGAYPILEGLRRLGDTAQIYAHLKDENAWLRMLREGATVTMEGWGKDTKWNTSLFHLTLSYAALFLI